MPTASHDLFDDSTMSFGEHLEVLRIHLFKALLGIALAICVTLMFGKELVGVVRQPIDAALQKYSDELEFIDDIEPAESTSLGKSLSNWFKGQFGFDGPPVSEESPSDSSTVDLSEIPVEVDAHALADGLHSLAPETYPRAPEAIHGESISLNLRSPAFRKWRVAAEELRRPVTLNVQEAFMTYLKVSIIAGLVFSSPWVFFQLWMFVAAGLYRNERKFVYFYGLLSLFLFLTGTVFCFRYVFPYVLDFLLSFNLWMGLPPRLRLSEWVSFAVILPVMFGVSFQLPLVMRFLHAVSIFSVENYQEKRRLSILVIAALSMFLTPGDPMSMLLMMFPLIILYEVGIWLCRLTPTPNPFEAEAA